jgi:hypothetical protein
VLAFLPSAIYYVMAPLSLSLALWLAFAAAFAVGLRYFGATGTVRIFDFVVDGDPQALHHPISLAQRHA